jgi:hypothetical protein
MRDGASYLLPIPALHICESASGLWQTPVADDAIERAAGKWNSRGEPKLSAEVKLWPTPTASLGTNGGRVTPSKAREGGTLIEALSARAFPTPAARDYRSPNAKPYSERGGGKKGEQLPNFIGGLLNPPWVEWLMGWPTGWTESAPLETDRFREWRQQHGNY